MGNAMALRSENGAPSFYTFTTFRPGRFALLYGGLLTILSFCVVVFLFNFGIREQLWSFEAVPYGSISPSPASTIEKDSNPIQAKRTIVRVALSDSTIHSLIGSYFSTTANRWYSLTLEGNRLSLQIDGQPKIELIPVSNHSLYANEDLAIEFMATSAGRADRLDVVHQLDVIHQLEIYDRGRHFIATRQ